VILSGALAPGFYLNPERNRHHGAETRDTGSGEFALFDVVYEDGSQRSNRKVPLAVLGGLDGDDEAARAAISEQDSAIAEKSGIAPMRIVSMRRSAR
jgi:hypothetical protein